MTAAPPRPTPPRRRALAAAALCTALALLDSPRAQEPRGRVVPRPLSFATSQDDNLFSLVRSEEDIHALELALAELAEGRHDAAVQRLHQLLRRDAGGVVPVGQGRFVGLRTAVVATLANLPPAAAAAYERLFDREAGDLATTPVEAFGEAQLLALAERFPTSARGRAARLRLGDLALQQGRPGPASEHFRAALDAAAIGSDGEQRANRRLACADAILDPALARARSAAGRLSPAAAEVLQILPANGAERGFPGPAGGRSGATPMAVVSGAPAPFWREEIVALGFDQREKGEVAMLPVGGLDGVFVNTGREVVAFDPLRRRVAWVSMSAMREYDQDSWAAVREYSDTVNQDAVLAAAVGEDAIVAALQVPDNSVNVDFQASFRIMSKIPQRRLFAFDRQTGKLRWSHFDELDGPRTRRFRGHDACGPPLVVGDTIYAPVHDRSGAIAFSIAAYDLHTGQNKWRRLVCSSQQDVNMFGNARMEFAASPLSIADGVIYGASNLGVVFALDAATGRIRWIAAYDVVRMPRPSLHNQVDRQVFFANNTPVICQGVVCCTPLDSQFALGIDTETGQTLWRLPYDASIGQVDNRIMWLAGTLDDEFVLSGAGVVAVAARPAPDRPAVRQLVRPDQLDDRRRARMPARPAVTPDHVFVPGRDAVLAFDRAGNPRAGAAAIRIDGYQPGNLLLVDGIIVSLRQRSFDVILDAEALVQHSRRRLETDPDDPAAILRLANLRRALLPVDAGVEQSDALTQMFRRGLDACIRRGLPAAHPVRQALQRELFEQALATAEAAAQRRRADAVDLLASARDLAPDPGRWIEVTARLLDTCQGDPQRYLAELDLLEQQAPAARMPGSGLPVPAFALWQRALASASAPGQAVGCWQQLLERHGAELLDGGPAAAVAEAAINRLIEQHGAAVYAAIAKRAGEALAAAGADRAALEQVAARFPNSEAAVQARRRLLDQAVQAGDLQAAAGGLATALRRDAIDPGVLRRVQIAAERRGNEALAAAIGRALVPHHALASDWPADQGATYGELARRAAATATPVGRPLPARPDRDAMRVPPRTSREYMRVPPLVRPAGFAATAAPPIYVIAGNELVAYDLAGGEPKLMFAQPIDFVDHLVLCGTVLIVPDTNRIIALDHRRGAVLWQHADERTRSFESLGVGSGVLHVAVQPNVPDGRSELLGIEPLSGALLFRRPLGPATWKPKPAGELLLVLQTADDTLELLAVDPVTGRTERAVPLQAAVEQGRLELRPDNLAARLYPQSLSAAGDLVFLPVDGSQANRLPQVLAIGPDGAIRWHWRGTTGAALVLAQRRGDRFAIVETSDQRPARALLLDAATGQVLREAQLGVQAVVLNWERSWLDNEAPAVLAIESLLERQSRQRQLTCFPVDGDDLPFAVALGVDDGEIERAPQFGDGFVTFVVRPARQRGPLRLYAIDLRTREGALREGRRHRPVDASGLPHGMSAAGVYTVLSTTQGLVLFGPDQSER